MKCKSIIEIEKQLRKDKQKKMDLLFRFGNTNRDKRVRQEHGAGSTYQPGQKSAFCPGCQTLLSRPGVPGWETGTTEVSQPGQISVSVVVRCPHEDNPAIEDILGYC